MVRWDNGPAWLFCLFSGRNSLLIMLYSSFGFLEKLRIACFHTKNTDLNTSIRLSLIGFSSFLMLLMDFLDGSPYSGYIDTGVFFCGRRAFFRLRLRSQFVLDPIVTINHLFVSWAFCWDCYFYPCLMINTLAMYVNLWSPISEVSACDDQLA